MLTSRQPQPKRLPSCRSPPKSSSWRRRSKYLKTPTTESSWKNPRRAGRSRLLSSLLRSPLAGADDSAADEQPAYPSYLTGVIDPVVAREAIKAEDALAGLEVPGDIEPAIPAVSEPSTFASLVESAPVSPALQISATPPEDLADAPVESNLEAPGLPELPISEFAHKSDESPTDAVALPNIEDGIGSFAGASESTAEGAPSLAQSSSAPVASSPASLSSSALPSEGISVFTPVRNEPSAPRADDPIVPFVERRSSGDDRRGTGSVATRAIFPSPKPSESGSEENIAPPALVPPGREPAPPAADRPEMARVDAELLDTLLNTAGEVSIAPRASSSSRWARSTSTSAELGRTVTRLKEQLRKLEIETEAQILHRHEDESTSHRSDFDPLELDRYSSIQQFSRALAETANDVQSIQSLLDTLAQDTQNLPAASRLAPSPNCRTASCGLAWFRSSVTCSASRASCVRPPSDTGKRAELVVEGASGELDRQVLERMLPPFEHMLRNAVVHGIEKPDERVAAGKSDAGRIVLELHREGAEVMVASERRRRRHEPQGDPRQGLRARAHPRRLDAQRRRRHAAHPGAGLLDRGQDHAAGRSRRRHGRGGHRDQASRRRAPHGDARGSGLVVHDSPAVHARHQPRARRAYG